MTGGGTISPSAGSYDTGTTLNMTVTPNAGWRFDHWTGALSGNTLPGSLTMDANKTVGAVFIQTYALTTSVTGSGSVAPASGTYDTGSTVSVTATPAAGWRFDHWENGAAGSANPVLVTMNANKAVKAVFVQQFTFSATASGQGTIDPASGVYDTGTNLSVTATPASGWRFGYWGGATTGTDNPGTVVMNANKTLTGYFIRQFAMASSVYGQGTVTPSSGLYDEGAYATINASPASGWRFHHWAGDASGTSTSTTIQMKSVQRTVRSR